MLTAPPFYTDSGRLHGRSSEAPGGWTGGQEMACKRRSEGSELQADVLANLRERLLSDVLHVPGDGPSASKC